ncbi:MAG: large conductance mechanosensitive channel protein MscL [Actinomycetota bacterium]
MLSNIVKEFREFALKGNMIELAVAFILGLAFNAVVQALANGVVLNLVAALFGQPSFDSIAWVVNDTDILIGALLAALVNFLVVALVLFMIVKTINRLRRPAETPPEPPNTRECPHCLTAIPVQATRCSACTSEVEPLRGVEPRV